MCPNTGENNSPATAINPQTAAARVAAVRPLTSVYAEDLHLLPCEIDEFIENIVRWTASTFGNDEVVAAREEFFWKNGKVFDDDHFFHERMIFFLDFFIFQRPISKLQQSGTMQTPFETYCSTPEPGESIERSRGSIIGARYSVFEIAKISAKELVVFDLLNDERHEISSRASQSFSILSRKDVFQGFLYKTQEHDAISLGTFFHAKETWSLVKNLIKKQRKAGSLDEARVLAALARTHLKALRHPHVVPKKIYSELNALLAS